MLAREPVTVWQRFGYERSGNRFGEASVIWSQVVNSSGKLLIAGNGEYEG